MTRIAAVTILYNPDQSTPVNILSYSNLVDRVYVIDNTELINDTIAQTIKQISNAVYYHDGQNQGIAQRLNEAADFSINDGYELLLTMDQDSFFKPGEIEKYLHCVQVCKDPAVAMYGVTFNEIVNPTKECNAQESLDLITSGSILNLIHFKALGDFDEALFIDEVDFEYSYRIRQSGYKSLLFSGIRLEHSLGNTGEYWSLTGKKTKRSLHSPHRIYYMVRNFFYVNNKYKNAFSDHKAKRKRALANRLKNNLIYNHSRFQVLGMAIKGYFDYLAMKTGKLNSK